MLIHNTQIRECIQITKKMPHSSNTQLLTDERYVLVRSSHWSVQDLHAYTYVAGHGVRKHFMHSVVPFDNIWSNMELYQFVQNAMIEISTPDSLAFGVITARFWFVDIHETNGFILNTKVHVITSDFNATLVVATRTWYICHWMLLSKFETVDGCVKA